MKIDSKRLVMLSVIAGVFGIIGVSAAVVSIYKVMNLQVDGKIYSGNYSGSLWPNNKPVLVDDSLKVKGQLTVATLGNRGGLVVDGVMGKLMFDSKKCTSDKNFSKCAGISGDKNNVYISAPSSGPFDNTMVNVDKSGVSIDGELGVYKQATFDNYIQLSYLWGAPPASDCAVSNGQGSPDWVGRMKFDRSSSKLWICGYDGWKSYSPD